MPTHVPPATPAPFHLGAYEIHGEQPARIYHRKRDGSTVCVGTMRDREAAVRLAFKMHERATATTARLPAIGGAA